MVNPEKIRALIREERFQAAYELYSGDPTLAESVEALRLLGLACVRMNKQAEAANYYEQVCDKSNDADDWFNLAMARLMSGDSVHGIIALEEAKRRHTESKEKMSVPMMLFYFIGGLLDLGMWDAAKRYLQELAEVYAGAGKCNDAYLYAHDLPYFSWFLNSVVTAFRSSHSNQAGITWLRSIAAKFDAEGQAKVENAIRLLSGPPAGSAPSAPRKQNET